MKRLLANSLFSVIPASILLVLVPLENANAATIINIDARAATAPNNPVTEFFTAGTYDVTPIGVADGGDYNAWNAWGNNVIGCNANGENCLRGWIYDYRIESDQFSIQVMNAGLNAGINGGNAFSTDLQALSNAVGTSFVLESDSNISFSIFDPHSINNSGGVSLKVERLENASVPEPSAILGLGTFALAGGTLLRRKRKIR